MIRQIISPELIYLTKNEGNNNSLVSEVLLLFFSFVSSSYLAFMFICSYGTIVDLVDNDFSCDELLNLFSVSFTHFQKTVITLCRFILGFIRCHSIISSSFSLVVFCNQGKYQLFDQLSRDVKAF